MAFVKEFLANSAADHGFTLKPAAVNLTEIATNAVRQYQEVARQKEIKIETGFSDGKQSSCLQILPRSTRFWII